MKIKSTKLEILGDTIYLHWVGDVEKGTVTATVKNSKININAGGKGFSFLTLIVKNSMMQFLTKIDIV